MDHLEDEGPQPEPIRRKSFFNMDDALHAKDTLINAFFHALGTGAGAAVIGGIVFGITVLTSRDGGGKPDA